MDDLELAKNNLNGHTLVLCKDGKLLKSSKRGITPMMDYIAAETDLKGYSAADIVVGKAAAMLFVKAGIAAVYAVTLSEGGREFLESHGIPVTYVMLTEHIINREGTGICPMESTVLGCDDEESGYVLLKAKLMSLRA